MQIKILRKCALAALLVVLAVPAHAGAQASSLNVSIKDQRLVVAYQASDGVLFGSVALRAPYQIVSLDALQFDLDPSIQGEGNGTGISGAGNGIGSLNPAWGYAEVLLGCGRADVIIYSNTEQGLEEALVATVAVDYCARP